MKISPKIWGELLAEAWVFECCDGQLTKDGNQWCALIGENLQDGVGYFSDDPQDAIAGCVDVFLNSHPSRQPRSEREHRKAMGEQDG